ILTCLITGFYPKIVKMSLRKFGTEIPDHLITSSGIRPNHNGTYQLRKSVEIQEDDSADFNCYVTHSSLTEPVIKQWGKYNPTLLIYSSVSSLLNYIYFRGEFFHFQKFYDQLQKNTLRSRFI
uniref:Ig-like domain-containing protein n=1 Tax=Astyanax mexicanus TaxID=7994 RepID=A0A8B9JF56_ASTMX